MNVVVFVCFFCTVGYNSASPVKVPDFLAQHRDLASHIYKCILSVIISWFPLTSLINCTHYYIPLLAGCVCFFNVWFCFTGPKCRGIYKCEEAVWRIQQNSILHYTKVSVLMLRLLTTHGLNVKSGFHCASSYSTHVFRVRQWQTTCLFDCWWFEAWMWRHFFNTCPDVSAVQTVYPVGWNSEETGSTQTSPVNRLVKQCLIFRH